MSGTCRTCRFWEPPDIDPPFGTCNGGIPYEGRTKLAYYIDYEGYSAMFRSKPEFGCALWEGPVSDDAH